MKEEKKTLKKILEKIGNPKDYTSGGAVLGLTGALTSKLGELIVLISKDQLLEVEDSSVYEEFVDVFQTSCRMFEEAAEMDSECLEKLMKAYHLPEETGEEKEEKDTKIKIHTREANEVSEEVINICNLLSIALDALSLKCNPSIYSDIGVCATLVASVMKGSWLNILTNTQKLGYEELRSITNSPLKELYDTTLKTLDNLFWQVEEGLGHGN